MPTDSAPVSYSRERLFALGACIVMLCVTASETNFDYPNPYAMLAAFGALALIVLLLTTKISEWVVVAYVVVAGIFMRLAMPIAVTTDDSRSMYEAILCVERLCNPYTHFYQFSIPPGAQLPYLPGGILYYFLENGWWNGLGAQYDRPAAIIVMLVFAALAWIYRPGVVALAASFYAVSSLVIVRSLDGSNDTALSALLGIGVAALAYANATNVDARRAKVALYCVSGIFFGWAIGFKLLAWPIYVMVIRAVPQPHRRRWLLWSLGAAAALILPFALWNVPGFVSSILSGPTAHTNAWGFSLWSAIDHLLPGSVARWGPIPVFFEVLGIGFAGWALWNRRTEVLGEALALGAAWLFVALGLARWSTSPYYSFAFAVVAFSIATFGSVRKDAAPPDRADEGMGELFSKG